ncbi:MAG: efflux RND transporter periplasmic adaptor subunit [bacterium]
MSKLFSGLIVLLFAIVILVSCNSPREKSEANELSSMLIKSIPVKTEIVAASDITRNMIASGVLEGWNDIAITAEVGGKLEKIFVNEGQDVKKGGKILELEHESLNQQLLSAEAALTTAEQALKKIERGIRPEEMAQIIAQLDSARTSFENADENFKSSQELYDEGVISKLDLDMAESQLAGAKAQYETALKNKELADIGAREEDRISAEAGVLNARARRDLAREQYNKAFFYSPFDGTVAFIYVDPGEMVTPGIPLINIVSLQTLKLSIAMNSEEAVNVKVGDEVLIHPEVNSSDVFTGTVSKIDIKADERTGTFSAEIKIDNSDGRLIPGMTATCKLSFGEHKDVLVIPLDSIINRGMYKFVFILEDGKAVQHQVITGVINENEAEIVDGLQAGQTLIIEGHKNLNDGDLVDVRGES